jgi:hypothetical protein
MTRVKPGKPEGVTLQFSSTGQLMVTIPRSRVRACPRCKSDSGCEDLHFVLFEHPSMEALATFGADILDLAATRLSEAPGKPQA